MLQITIHFCCILYLYVYLNYCLNRGLRGGHGKRGSVFCGIAPHWTEDVSSSNIVSRTQCGLFSIDQCPRRSLSKRSADTSLGSVTMAVIIQDTN